MDKQKKDGWMDGKGLLLRELHDSVRAGITSILGTWGRPEWVPVLYNNAFKD